MVHIFAIFPSGFSHQAMTESVFAIPALFAAWLIWRRIRWVALLLIFGLAGAIFASIGHIGHSTVPDILIDLLIAVNIGAAISSIIAFINHKKIK